MFEGGYEIVDGVPVESPPTGVLQTVAAFQLAFELQRFLKTRPLGIACAETLFALEPENRLHRRPDVAFVAYSRWPEPTLTAENAWNVVPDLAVEVVSRTDLAEAIEVKVREYLTHGVRLVWVVYPQTLSAHVFSCDGKAARVDRDGALVGGDVLPGFRLPLAAFFDGLRRPEPAPPTV